MSLGKKTQSAHKDYLQRCIVPCRTRLVLKSREYERDMLTPIRKKTANSSQPDGHTQLEAAELEQGGATGVGEEINDKGGSHERTPRELLCNTFQNKGHTYFRVLIKSAYLIVKLIRIV